MEAKLKHLEFIQNVIDRMASNSSTLKGWCITVVTALLTLTTTNNGYYIVLVYPIVMFWLLDAYFLRLERLFRKKYDEVRQTPPELVDFSMNISSEASQINSWLRSVLSQTLLVFYGGMSGVIFWLVWMLKL